VDVDLTVIGAGPVGPYAAYYAGFRGVCTAIVDSLPEPRGQIAARHPHEYIDRGACEPACPVGAISSDLLIAADLGPWRDGAFFGQVLPGRDEPLAPPGGAAGVGPFDADAPLAAVTPATVDAE
jgi:hypothetical protein